MSNNSGTVISSGNALNLTLKFYPKTKGFKTGYLLIEYEGSVGIIKILMKGICFDTGNSIAENEANNQISISPNPSQDFCIIKIDDKIGEINELYLLDNLGRKVREISRLDLDKSNDIILNSRDLSNGAYTLVCVGSSGPIYKKLVIAR